jgi:hypothetical protein
MAVTPPFYLDGLRPPSLPVPVNPFQLDGSAFKVQAGDASRGICRGSSMASLLGIVVAQGEPQAALIYSESS